MKSKASLGINGILAAALLVAVVAARAEPGDDAAVAQARKEYAQAMKGHDVGLQNATKIGLSVQIQLAKARAEAARKNAGKGAALNETSASDRKAD